MIFDNFIKQFLLHSQKQNMFQEKSYYQSFKFMNPSKKADLTTRLPRNQSFFQKHEKMYEHEEKVLQKQDDKRRLNRSQKKALMNENDNSLIDEAVFGKANTMIINRERVKEYPYCLIGYIESEFEGQDGCFFTNSGTGCLINQTTVLTAAHVISVQNKIPFKCTFKRAMYQDQSSSYTAHHYHIPLGYTQNYGQKLSEKEKEQRRLFDYALIKVRIDKPTDVKFNFLPFNLEERDGGDKIMIFGYPQINKSEVITMMKGESGELIDQIDDILKYRTNTYPGHSGAPIIIQKSPNKFEIIGIHRGVGPKVGPQNKPAYNEAIKITRMHQIISNQWGTYKFTFHSAPSHNQKLNQTYVASQSMKIISQQPLHQSLKVENKDKRKLNEEFHFLQEKALLDILAIPPQIQSLKEKQFLDKVILSNFQNEILSCYIKGFYKVDQRSERKSLKLQKIYFQIETITAKDSTETECISIVLFNYRHFVYLNNQSVIKLKLKSKKLSNMKLGNVLLLLEQKLLQKAINHIKELDFLNQLAVLNRESFVADTKKYMLPEDKTEVSFRYR